MGRHKESAEVLQLRGSRMAKEREKEEAEVLSTPSAKLKPPTWLDATAREQWRWITSCLEGTALLAELDQSALAALCSTWSQLRKHEAAIEKEGAVIRTARGVVRNPRCMLRDQCFDRWLELSKRFGLDPKSRKALGHALTKKKVVNSRREILHRITGD